METSLPPLHTSQIASLPPADYPSFFRKDLSQQSISRPSYSDSSPRRASTNRYSWSSVSSPSPTSSDNAATTTRKFKLPVRVSTDLTSFTSSDSSPESRRRSLSLASDSKRRSRTINPQQVEDKVADTKKSSSKDSPPPPPPAYEKTSVSSESKKETPPAEPKADAPPPPPYEKPTSSKKPEPSSEPEPKKEAPQPRKEPEPPRKETVAPRQVPTTTTQKMSSSP